MDWPYHRPIPIWCKDRPKWCDLGPERDMVRLLKRAAAHLAMLEADHDVINQWAWNETEWLLEAMSLLRAQKDLQICANKVRKDAKTNTSGIPQGNAGRTAPRI